MLRTERNNQQWLDELHEPGEKRDTALEDLRKILGRGLRRTLAVEESHVDDFVQEALIKCLEKLESFRGESRFTTWALTIAVRVAFTEMRKRRWKDVSLDEMTDGGDLNPVALMTECDSIEKRILLDKIVATLYDTIKDKLTEKQRQTIFAELVNEAPLEEIARRMGTTRNALYKLSHDARRRLRKALSEVGVSGDDVRFALDL